MTGCRRAAVALLLLLTACSGGAVRRAAEALRKTIVLDSSNLSAYAMLGGIYGAQSRLDDARKQFQNWATQQPRSVAAHTMLALMFEKEERPADARKAYEKILEIDPKKGKKSGELNGR